MTVIVRTLTGLATIGDFANPIRGRIEAAMASGPKGFAANLQRSPVGALAKAPKVKPQQSESTVAAEQAAHTAAERLEELSVLKARLLEEIRRLQDRAVALRAGGERGAPAGRKEAGAPDGSFGDEEAVQKAAAVLECERMIATGWEAMADLQAQIDRAADKSERASAALKPARQAVSRATRRYQNGELADAHRVVKHLSRAVLTGPYLAVLTALILAFALGSFPSTSQGVEARLELGAKAEDQGRTEEAERIYQEVLRDDPDNQIALYRLGLLAQMAQSPHRAEEYYNRLLRQNPDSLQGLVNLALVQQTLGNHEAAAQLYRKAIASYPSQAIPRFNLGVLLVRHLGEPAEGEAMIQQAIELDPSLPESSPE